MKFQNFSLIGAREKSARFVLIGVGAATFLAQGLRTTIHPRGDFLNHREFGRRFAAREFLYADGLDVPYPPAWAMAHAPLALVPAKVALPLFFLVGTAALLALIQMLNKLTQRVFQVGRGDSFWVIAGAIFLASRFLLRDFADGGQNTLLVALAFAAVFFWRRGRDLAGGAALGLVIALKCTPLLLLAYFAGKRQWKIAFAALAGALFFSALPAVWMGPAAFAAHSRAWLATVRTGVSQSDPSIGVLGPEALQNKSLRPALARYLMHLPNGHPGRVDASGYLDFFDLTPKAARATIGSLLGALIVFTAWRFRHPVRGRDDETVWWECAMIFLLMPLLSPISWGQHFVAALPTFYLAVRLFLRTHDRTIFGALVLIGLMVLATNRAFLGRDLALLLESYHLVTFAMLGLLALAFACHHRSVSIA